MDFFKYSKKLIKTKNNDKCYTTNPFKQNKQVTFIWVEENLNSEKSNYCSDSSVFFNNFSKSDGFKF